MQTNEIIEQLEKSAEWEDDFILNYDTEIVWELFKTLIKEKFERIKPLLEENIKDSYKHREAIKLLIEKLGKR